MPTDHKMLGTDSDGRLGETVRHFGKIARARLCASSALRCLAATTDGFDGRLTGRFGATVRPQEAQESGGNG